MLGLVSQTFRSNILILLLYGIVKLTRKKIIVLVETIDLISVSPSISSKFREKVEKIIFPRFMELNNMIYSEK